MEGPGAQQPGPGGRTPKLTMFPCGRPTRRWPSPCWTAARMRRVAICDRREENFVFPLTLFTGIGFTVCCIGKCSGSCRRKASGPIPVVAGRVAGLHRWRFSLRIRFRVFHLPSLESARRARWPPARWRRCGSPRRRRFLSSKMVRAESTTRSIGASMAPVVCSVPSPRTLHFPGGRNHRRRPRRPRPRRLAPDYSCPYWVPPVGSAACSGASSDS